MLCDEDDDYLDSSEAWKVGVSEADLPPNSLQLLESGKWYTFFERIVYAFPAKSRGYLSANIQSNMVVETMVGRAKYVGTLGLCSWFPREEVTSDDVVVQGINGVCSMEDVLIFLQTPPVPQRVAGEIWIAFALHRADVSDLTLDQA